MARVQRMLDACAELLDEAGYAELTTTKIAERAGVAIGSVYQFFPDKKAITQALGLRYLDIFSARIVRRITEQNFDHWTETVDAIIDEYVTMHREEPGFRFLRFGDAIDPKLLDSTRENNQVIATRLRDLLISLAGAVQSEKLDLAVLVSVEAADAVLKMAFREDPNGDPRLVSAAKLLVRSYLEHVFGDERTPPRNSTRVQTTGHRLVDSSPRTGPCSPVARILSATVGRPSAAEQRLVRRPAPHTPVIRLPAHHEVRDAPPTHPLGRGAHLMREELAVVADSTLSRTLMGIANPLPAIPPSDPAPTVPIAVALHASNRRAAKPLRRHPATTDSRLRFYSAFPSATASQRRRVRSQPPRREDTCASSKPGRAAGRSRISSPSRNLPVLLSPTPSASGCWSGRSRRLPRPHRKRPARRRRVVNPVIDLTHVLPPGNATWSTTRGTTSRGTPLPD